jgi:hypothetical protein
MQKFAFLLQEVRGNPLGGGVKLAAGRLPTQGVDNFLFRGHNIRVIAGTMRVLKSSRSIEVSVSLDTCQKAG